MTREEAIKVANEMYGWVKTDREREALETLVPELAESEDEKMRKELIFFLKEEIPQCSIKEHADKLKEFVSYLEKQKEQKSLNISAASEWLKEHVCNYINSEYNEFHKCIEYDGSIDKESLINDFEEAMQKEQKPVEWSEEDEAHRKFILESLEDQIRFCKKNAEGAYYAKQIRTAQNWLNDLPNKFNSD